MKFRKYIFLLFLFYSYSPVLAQVDTAWVRRYNGPGNAYDEGNSMAIDDIGNVYVTGWSIGSGTNYDYATIKYAPNGDTLWVRRYNGPANSSDQAFAMAVDKNYNVYVTGGSNGSGTGSDYATIKYGPNGDTLWVRRYNYAGSGSDAAYAIQVVDSGYVYVTGRSYGGATTNIDYATIKYAPNGNLLWIRRYNGPLNMNSQYGDDWARALAVDDNGNVYITGQSQGFNVIDDYLTIKYKPNGDTAWVRRYNGPGNSYDFAFSLALDNSGNIYVNGYSYGSGNSVADYATIKYASNGNTLWVRRYNGPENGYDYSRDVTVDKDGIVYTTGESQGSGTSFDFATIKYSAVGDTVWVRRYNGPGNGNDYARALAVDDSGNVYVAGDSYDSSSLSDYATIKYASNGNSLWVERYNGPGNNLDGAYAIKVDDSGNVYVTGRSRGIGSDYDYATIKYSPCVAKPGDVTGDGNVLLPDIVAIINFLFKSAPAPNPLCRGDANGNGTVLLPDIVYLINFIFKSGPAPIKSQECCL